VPGLETDVDYRAQYAWLSSHGLDGCTSRNVRIDHVKKGEHDGHYLINGRIRATFEHPFLVRRGDQWGFASAHLLEIGDRLVIPAAGGLGEERIDSIEAIAGVVRTVAIHVPGTNTFLADGAWTHNDISLTLLSSSSGSSSSGSGSSSSGSGKDSGSSFSGGSSASGGTLGFSASQPPSTGVA
jgi:uncharacterized membrane protein YgcG